MTGMDPAKVSAKDTGLPDGYVAIPVSPAEQNASLRICVLARVKSEPAAGHLVTLRDLLDTRVYLGCVTDAAGKLREWIELRVQNVDGLETGLSSRRDTFTNLTLDARWAEEARAFQSLNPSGFIS